MSLQASANRYARALLDVAIKEADPVKAEQELSAFADLFGKHADLRKALLNPAVPVTAKRAVVEHIVARLKPSKPVGKLLLLLADRDRLDLVPLVAAAYRERLMDYQHIVRADVVTTVPLPADRAAKLQQQLADATGRTVTMTTRIDPAIIGGIVARVGGTVYDASVATHLARLKDKLVQSV